MQALPGIDPIPTGVLTVLSVSGNKEDHSSLERIFGHSIEMLFTAQNISTARAVLHEHDVSVVFCERDLMPGTWIDILKHTSLLPHPPSLIVTSRLADERLWAEALNLGAWDVLAKPLDRGEVMRSVKTAWLHWHHQIQMPAMTLEVITAA